ncbi:MAG: hypothetical protein JNM86_00040 [Phycisphaerae bacterium]|nr:hypothetical protein [Phycisphaerae bacterium]
MKPSELTSAALLREITESWLEEIQGAVYRQAVTAISENPVNAEEVITAARRKHETQFDAAFKQCLERAVELGTHSEVFPILNWTRHAIECLERESLVDPIRSYIRHERQGGQGTPWLNAKERGDWLVKAFVRMAPLIDGPRKMSGKQEEQNDVARPLTDRQLEIWDLLHGRALDAKQIAEKLGSGITADSVRQTMMELRKARPNCIKSRRGRGYYRLDAPPTK